MSTTGQFVWTFDEGTINKFEALLEDGRFEDVAEEILTHTYLSTVFVDEVRGIRSDYENNEDSFNNDVLIAIRIIHDKYKLLQEENKDL